MWIGGSSPAAIRRTARFGTGWQAGGEAPEEIGAVVEQIRAAAIEAGRPIDEDHYGAGLAFRFGDWQEPGVAPLAEAYRRRTGRDPARYFAIGGAGEILDRIALYVAAGISKFILRPVAKGEEEMLGQTRRLIEEVLPRAAERWPRRKKAAA